jgi:hypothetical protein
MRKTRNYVGSEEPPTRAMSARGVRPGVFTAGSGGSPSVVDMLHASVWVNAARGDRAGGAARLPSDKSSPHGDKSSHPALCGDNRLVASPWYPTDLAVVHPCADITERATSRALCGCVRGGRSR